MLSKRERHTREQFTALLLAKGLRTVYNRLGTLTYLSGGRSLSVVTSGKHEKHAVARNRLRRRIYGAFQNSPARLSGIFYASKQSYGFTAEETTALAMELFAKASR